MLEVCIRKVENFKHDMKLASKTKHSLRLRWSVRVHAYVL